MAVVRVPDRRLQVLANMFKPQKVTPATVEYIDVGGITGAPGTSGELGGKVLSALRNVDALLHVVRVEEGGLPPREAIDVVDLELALSDLGQIDKRLTRLAESAKKPRGPEREAEEREASLLHRFKEALERGTPLRDLEVSQDEEKLMRTFQFLTAKPLLILLNVDESLLPRADALAAEVQKGYTHKKAMVASISGKIEMELAQLEEADAAIFMADLGIAESGLNRVIRLSYSLLGMISFFTINDELRAWAIKNGTHVQQAAGVIHSDMERGFIRAEVIHYDELVRLGSLAEARRAGLLRIEGKTYVVKDGDVIHILFHV
jgi:GTP-binding protein YchF